MKKPFTMGANTAAILGATGTGWLLRRSMNSDHEMKFAAVQAAWEKERAEQAAALKNAKTHKEAAALPSCSPLCRRGSAGE